MKKVILAYSGGLDTSCCIPYLREKGFRVICFSAKIGQKENFNEIKKRALRLGAEKIYIKDLLDEFLKDFILPSLWAKSLYESKYPLFTSLSRPLIAKYLVEIAKAEKTDFVAHGCTGKGNDQVRIEVSAKILNPKIKILAPVREWHFKSREEQAEFLLKKGLKLKVKKSHPYSLDENIWGLSIEAGPLEDLKNPPPKDSYFLVRAPEFAINKPIDLEIELKEGIPFKLNGKKVSFKKMIEILREAGAKTGVGRIDMIENRLVGIKSREIYETPQSVILHKVYEELYSLVLDRETLHFFDILSSKYSELIYYGLFFTDLKIALDKFFDYLRRFLTGKIKLRLYKGNIQILERYAKHSLYKKELATYSKESVFNQKWAEGFIEIFRLPFIRK